MDDNKGLPYFFLGIGVGVAIGMIFAPKAGAETRTLIRNRANEGGDYLRRRGTQIREGATDLIDKGKGLVDRQREHLSSAMDAGRQAYREAVSSGPGTPNLDVNPNAEGI